MKSYIQEYLRRLTSLCTLATWALFSVILAIASPFGAFNELSAAGRILNWASILALSIAVAYTVRPALKRIVPDTEGWNRTLLATVILAVIYTPVLHAYALWLVGEAGRERVPEPTLIFALVLLVPIASNAVAAMLYDDAPNSPNTKQAVDPSSEMPRLFRRLRKPAEQIYHMSVRDHYVEVFSDAGQDTLLLRFSDALEEIEGAEGLRVHRSHWVSTDAVQDVLRENGRMFLRLSCGTQVPVSRSYRPDVERAFPAASGI